MLILTILRVSKSSLNVFKLKFIYFIFYSVSIDRHFFYACQYVVKTKMKLNNLTQEMYQFHSNLVSLLFTKCI